VSISEPFIRSDKASLPTVARRLLGVTAHQQEIVEWRQDDYAPLRGWREAVEALGVLVIQAGPVPVQTMRGFASLEPAALPAILLNNKDHPKARAFTLLHELAHLILSRRGASVGAQTKRWCESFAGQVLMPASRLGEVCRASSSATALGRIHDVARTFNVTPLAAAVRITRASLVTREAGGASIGAIQNRHEEDDETSSSGGSYYLNQVSRFGPGYLGLVFAALDAGTITLPTASTLLDGVKVKNFRELRSHIESR